MKFFGVSVSPGSHQLHCVLAMEPGVSPIYSNFLIQFIIMQRLVMNNFIQFIKRSTAMFIFAPITYQFPFAFNRIKMDIVYFL